MLRGPVIRRMWGHREEDSHLNNNSNISHSTERENLKNKM